MTGANRRRVFGEYQNTSPSQFLDEVPAELVEEEFSRSSYSPKPTSGWEYRANPYARRPQPPVPTYAYEDEDQTPGLRPGVNVRHQQFGFGTVLSVEDLDDDQKLVVRFASVGQKTLRARYAKLQRA
jgi:DNA helicase-2/ATP-dependent DNA helicase PcrA